MRFLLDASETGCQNRPFSALAQCLPAVIADFVHSERSLLPTAGTFFMPSIRAGKGSCATMRNSVTTRVFPGDARRRWPQQSRLFFLFRLFLSRPRHLLPALRG